VVVVAKDPAVPNCAISDVSIQLITPGIGLTIDDVITHFAKSPIGFLDPLDSIFSCVDGRSTVGICLFQGHF
jgi:hypothetical protein